MQMGQTDDDGQIGCPESDTLVTLRPKLTGSGLIGGSQLKG